ncbi:hypothetical protein LCGC14_1426070 [marine sediment metagenome]|uniref:SprT-like domain-containing protein n=1 Tax=marine sediment metagenome TaxID=412755 RepID=A0A0F9JQF4_9ZZZZ
MLDTATENTVQGSIAEAVKLCPVSVLFEVVDNCYAGQYRENAVRTEIAINTVYLTPVEQLSTLVHETQHANCELNKCRCCGTTARALQLSEYHAFKAQVKYAVNHASIPGLVDCTLSRIRLGTGKNEHLLHRRACKQIIKLRAFKKLEKLKDFT